MRWWIADVVARIATGWGAGAGKDLECWGQSSYPALRITVPGSARSWSAAQLRCWWHSDGSCPPAFRACQDITMGSGPNAGEQSKPYCLMLVQLNMGNMKHCDTMPNGKEVALVCLTSSPNWLFLWRENKANCILIDISFFSQTTFKEPFLRGKLSCWKSFLFFLPFLHTCVHTPHTGTWDR